MIFTGRRHGYGDGDGYGYGHGVTCDFRKHVIDAWLLSVLSNEIGDDEMRCQQWSEHQWGRPSFVESGTDPTLGPYTRYAVSCEREGCDRQTIETRWNRPSSLRPIAREGIEA